MKIRNHVIYSSDQSYLERLRDEYENYCGRSCRLIRGKLIVYAVDRRRR